jgi:hypothetical protein
MQDPRIEEIRAKVRAERAEISALACQLTNSGLIRELRLATMWLNDVESFYIPFARTTVQSQTWIDRAVETLACVVQRKEFVRKAIATHSDRMAS